MMRTCETQAQDQTEDHGVAWQKCTTAPTAWKKFVFVEIRFFIYENLFLLQVVLQLKRTLNAKARFFKK